MVKFVVVAFVEFFLVEYIGFNTILLPTVSNGHGRMNKILEKCVFIRKKIGHAVPWLSVTIEYQKTKSLKKVHHTRTQSTRSQKFANPKNFLDFIFKCAHRPKMVIYVANMLILPNKTRYCFIEKIIFHLFYQKFIHNFFIANIVYKPFMFLWMAEKWWKSTISLNHQKNY